jgi:hypothetical protein
MKSKKGQWQFAIVIVIAIIIGALALPFLFGGGLSASWKAGQLLNQLISILKSIPAPVWIVIGFLWLISLIRRKK